MPTIHEQRAMLAALKAELEQGEEMSYSARGSIDLRAAKIDDQGRSWIEVMPTVEKARNGDWYFTITAEDLTTLADFITANPDRIPIDYDHAGAEEKGSTRAAGWFTGDASVVKAGEQNYDGEVQDRASVWAQVKWTPTAIEEIRGGDFRFISPEWGMAAKDKKTGLLTKLKDLAAATLTNRPFFKDLAAVKARQLMESEQIDAISEDYGSDVAQLVLAIAESEDEEVVKAREAILAAVWTTAFINNLPDSSFLYIEPGGEKDSDGKTTPRSLRHFPVKDANGSPDLAHVRNALARIPQSNVPAEAKAKATAAAQRLLKEAGGNPSASEEKPNEPEEEIVAEEKKAPDYLKILGLDETADPNKKIAAALNQKDEEILELTGQVTELTAKLKESDALNERVAELEARDRQRDNEVYLARAVEKGQVLPAEKEALSKLFADNVSGLRELIATRPSGFAKTPLEPKGIVGDPDRFGDDAEVAAYVKANTYTEPVDTESAKVHLQAMQILKDKGKEDDYTPDDYIKACEEAEKQLVY
jgi:phage I-like protein